MEEAALKATPDATPEPRPAEPLRPLWFKSDQLDDVEAETYLERTLDRNDMAQLNAVGIEADTDADGMVITVDGLSYGEVLEPHGLLFTNEVNEPGLNAWVRGFGGGSSNGAAGDRYANFSNGGSQIGFDIPINDETRIGLFGTYAVMNGTDGARGSWDSDGWGGGAYAEYWTSDFYLRGMVSAGGYDGEHRRKIDGETAKGDRSGNSWTGVLNIGAPLQSGDWIIEPQAQLSYTNTSLDKFSEHGANRRDRLRFHEMEVDQLGSELSVKFAIPIRDGERSLFLPSLRVGWAADWGMSGDHQKVSYLESGKSQRWDVNGNDDHAALVELGLDYTTFNFQDTSMGVYARGGGLLWAGNRGTSWQVQGGLNFKF
jgi:outer membrane autotransporter protein